MTERRAGCGPPLPSSPHHHPPYGTIPLDDAVPDLETPLHAAMYQRFRREAGWPARLRQAVAAFRREWRNAGVYGMRWGDPETVPPLRWVRDRFLLPYVGSDRTAVEIGPGGGRWTQYLLPCRRLYLVDYVPEVLAEARRRWRRYPNVTFILNHGCDFPGIPPATVDFVFSFGTFVHLELPAIAAYLANLPSILAPAAQVVLQYADQTKVMARHNPGFAATTPEQVRGAVVAAGFEVLEEDLTTLWHSSLIRFRLHGGEGNRP